MRFKWIDYSSDYADLIDSWLDETAVAMTGIDFGWDNYWKAVIADSVNYPGCIDFCKLVSLDGVPIAVVSFGCFQGDLTVSQIVIDPALRSKGYGTLIIRELIACSDLWFRESVARFRAVVFLQNFASQKVFQKAGFSIFLMNDGSAFECLYSKTDM